jgi:hypothetical protein
MDDKPGRNHLQIERFTKMIDPIYIRGLTRVGDPTGFPSSLEKRRIDLLLYPFRLIWEEREKA